MVVITVLFAGVLGRKARGYESVVKKYLELEGGGFFLGFFFQKGKLGLITTARAVRNQHVPPYVLIISASLHVFGEIVAGV